MSFVFDFGIVFPYSLACFAASTCFSILFLLIAITLFASIIAFRVSSSSGEIPLYILASASLNFSFAYADAPAFVTIELYTSFAPTVPFENIFFKSDCLSKTAFQTFFFFFSFSIP